MHRRFRLPSPAMAVACLALLVALGGTSYAAVKIPAKSVGREQLRNGAVGLSTIRANAVDSTKIVDHTILRKDLKAGVIPAAPVTTVRQVSGQLVSPGQTGSATAECMAGEHATGGGGGFAGPPTTGDSISESIPVGDAALPTKWRTTLNNAGMSPRTPVAYVICSTG